MVVGGADRQVASVEIMKCLGLQVGLVAGVALLVHLVVAPVHIIAHLIGHVILLVDGLVALPTFPVGLFLHDGLHGWLHHRLYHIRHILLLYLMLDAIFQESIVDQLDPLVHQLLILHLQHPLLLLIPDPLLEDDLQGGYLPHQRQTLEFLDPALSDILLGDLRLELDLRDLLLIQKGDLILRQSADIAQHIGLRIQHDQPIVTEQPRVGLLGGYVVVDMMVI